MLHLLPQPVRRGEQALKDGDSKLTSRYTCAVPRSRIDTRERILQAAYGLFYAKGFARVGVDSVAEKAGLTKHTLYYHFRSKDELLAAVLDHRGELALERIQRWAAGLKGDAETFVEALFRELSRWVSRPGWEGAGFTRVVDGARRFARSPGASNRPPP